MFFYDSVDTMKCFFIVSQRDDRFMPSFLKSVGYVNMLIELDLLPKDVSKSDEEDSRSLDEVLSLCSMDADEDKERENYSCSSSGPPLKNAEFFPKQAISPHITFCNLKATIRQKGIFFHY